MCASSSSGMPGPWSVTATQSSPESVFEERVIFPLGGPYLAALSTRMSTARSIRSRSTSSSPSPKSSSASSLAPRSRARISARPATSARKVAAGTCSRCNGTVAESERARKRRSSTIFVIRVDSSTISSRISWWVQSRSSRPTSALPRSTVRGVLSSCETSAMKSVFACETSASFFAVACCSSYSLLSSPTTRTTEYASAAPPTTRPPINANSTSRAVAGLDKRFGVLFVGVYRRPEAGVILLRHLAELFSLDVSRRGNADIFEFVDLVLQPLVSSLEIGDAVAGRAGEGDVAVVVAHVEDRHSEVVGLVLQFDVVPERLVGDPFDTLVYQEAHESGDDARH